MDKQKEVVIYKASHLDKLPPASDLDLKKDYESDKEYRFRKETVEKKEVSVALSRRTSSSFFQQEKEQIPEPEIVVQELSFSKFQKKEISDSAIFIQEVPEDDISLKNNDNFPKSLIYRRAPALNSYPLGPSNALYNSQVILNLNELRENFTNISKTSKHDFRNQRYDELIFDSNFESGNLYEVHRVSLDEYDLVMQSDFNTKGYNQWFYFSVRNTKKGNLSKFNIINFLKVHPFLRSGVMKPCVYSEKDFDLNKTGWRRYAEKTHFFDNGRLREKNGKTLTYFTFSWIHKFEHDNDRVYFALNYPYTYTQMMRYIDKIVSDSKNSSTILAERSILCETLTKKSCPLLTLTSKKYGGDSFEHKRVAVITARQHPGETVSSYECEGYIDFLLGNSPEAIFLRENYVFKIFPMLNPDGVYYGNFRCGLSGEDLNRRWFYPKKEVHPTIYHCLVALKSIIKDKGKIDYFLDLHGHSKKHDAFIYACLFSNEDQPYRTMIYPKIFSQINPFFNFNSCTFGLSKMKEKSARGVLWKMLSQPNIFTLETSFFGYKDKNGVETVFTINDLNQIGRDAAKAFHSFSSKYNTKRTKRNKSLTVDNMIEELQSKYNELKLNTISNNQDSGSETDPSADELQECERTVIFIKPPTTATTIKRPPDNLRKEDIVQRKILTRSRILRTVNLNEKVDFANSVKFEERIINGKIKVDKACQTSFSFEDNDMKDENKGVASTMKESRVEPTNIRQKQEYVLKNIQFQGKSLKGIAALGTFVKFSEKANEKSNEFSDSVLYKSKGSTFMASTNSKSRDRHIYVNRFIVDDFKTGSLERDQRENEQKEQSYFPERAITFSKNMPKSIMIRKLRTGKNINTPRLADSLSPKNPSTDYFPSSFKEQPPEYLASKAALSSVESGWSLIRKSEKDFSDQQVREDAKRLKESKKNPVRNQNSNLKVTDMVNIWRDNKKKFGGNLRLSTFSKSNNII